MDEKDKQILASLRVDAKASTRSISKKTHLPITTVHNRILKLKEAGVIKQFTIEVDHASVDEGFSAHVLIFASLERLKAAKKTQYDIAKELRKFPEIKRISIVSGSADIVAFLRTKDVASFDSLLLSRIQQIDGISKTQTLITIHESQ